MAEDQVNAFYVMPWLRLHDNLTFGLVEVGPAEGCLSACDPRTATVKRILGLYEGLGGAQLTPSLMWMTGGDPIGVDPDDFPTIAAARDYLSAAAIMGNSYLDPADAPITDAHCDGYFQRFTTGADFVTLTKRRREGQFLDGWPIDRARTQIPLAATPAHQFHADPALLDAFADLTSRQSDVDLRIESALPFFVQANRLSERTSLQYDLVFLGAAFERLFEIIGGKAAGLADAVTDLLSLYEQGSTTWHNRAVSSQNLHQDQGPWVKRWMREFYDHRSAIHGQPAHSNEWLDVWHGLIGTEVFSLSVKILLERDGVRTLTDDDKIASGALDDRIEHLAGQGVDAQATWREAYQRADRRAMVESVAQALADVSDGES
jgi:hypothetical protein